MPNGLRKLCVSFLLSVSLRSIRPEQNEKNINIVIMKIKQISKQTKQEREREREGGREGGRGGGRGWVGGGTWIKVSKYQRMGYVYQSLVYL